MSELSPQQIYDAFSAYTMVPRERFVENLEHASALAGDANFPHGAIVECGVWRGGMSAGWMHVFGKSRQYWLFDSFQGLPAPGPKDGDDARWWAAHPEHPRYFENCRAETGELAELLKEPHLSQMDVRVVAGRFSETLPLNKPGRIAFLHLDCDWYESIMQCLHHLWSDVAPGGVVVVDDYFDWDGCRRAIHDFLALSSAREAIERVGRTGGALIRKRGQWDLSQSPHLGEQ